MTYVALLGGVIVAHIQELPYSYLLVFQDGRRIPAASFDEIRSNGYEVQLYRPQTTSQAMSCPDWGDRQETPGHQTPDSSQR